ncbi:primosomal protein [Microbacterium sp. 179-B 1A2 NHS]|uniref:primosomal protein n=1 Tax=Microbacterium sp. 179-B 1A2 NHS TaxID=3142383 RepID=UPI00399F6467
MTEEERPGRDGGKRRFTPSSSSSRSERPRSPRPEGEKRSFPRRDGESRPYPKRDAESRPAEKRDGDARPYSKRSGDGRPNQQRDGGARPYAKRDGDKRPFEKRDGERRPYEKRDGECRPFEKRDGERRPFEKRDGERRPFEKRDGERRPFEKRDGERRPFEKRDGERRPYEKRDGERRPYEKRDGERRPYEKRGGGAGSFERRSSRPPQDSERRSQPSGPVVPDDVTAADLNGAARNELKTLSKDNAEQVARHLAMAARLIDEDPALAHEHALAASRSAGRIAVVRETVAITAYALGDFALALRELRTYRRISGKDDQIALMVDSERGVGRPDRALEVGRAVDRAALPIEVRVELAIAMSGARLDLGESARALQELDIPELDPDRAFSWSPALFSARAAVLEELGRDDEAAEWYRRADIAADVLDAQNADSETIEVDEIDEVEIVDAPIDDDSAHDRRDDAAAPGPTDGPTEGDASRDDA